MKKDIISYSYMEKLLALLWVVIGFANYFSFTKLYPWLKGLPQFWLVLGLLHLVSLMWMLTNNKFQVENGQIKFKKFSFRKGIIHWVSVTDIIKIEEDERKMGGVYRMHPVPIFYFYTKNREKYEVFPATDKQVVIEKYRSIITQNIRLPIEKRAS